MEVSRIKSPLRYPGGKSKALKEILSAIPNNFEEFREPMVGGGSIFTAIKQLNQNKKFWINDINEDLFQFWNQCKISPDKLVKKIKYIKENEMKGKILYKKMSSYSGADPMKKAIRFFVLNRISFSGLSDSGGFSEESFNKRFTLSSIERIRGVASLMKNVEISNKDYSILLDKPGKKVFIFLDPPYFSATKSALYGKNGDIHKRFNHEEFAKNMRNCKHRWLITYDDHQEIRRLFNFAPYMYEWELQYGMNNYKQKKAAKGKELFISNFPLKGIN